MKTDEKGEKELEYRVGDLLKKLKVLHDTQPICSGLTAGDLKEVLSDIHNFIDVMKFEMGEDITS